MGQSSKQGKLPIGGGLFGGALIYIGLGELARVARTGTITWINRTKPNVLITHAEYPIAFDFMLTIAIGSTLFGLLIIYMIVCRTIRRWRS